MWRRLFQSRIPKQQTIVPASALLLTVTLLALPLFAREKDAIQYGTGLIVNIPLPESEVTQVVQEVALNGIIRGTKEYKKDEYVSGASAASSTKVFRERTEGGKVFYKLRLKTLNPQNFKDGSDVGTLAVRYIVQAQDDKHTVLHIDARFVEDYRRVSHLSNGSVESAEYKAIRDKLDAIEAMKNQTEELNKEKEASIRSTSAGDAAVSQSSSFALSATPVTSSPIESDPTKEDPTPLRIPPQTLEDRVHDLRHQVQRVVKVPGAALKSAPFHTASALQALPAGEQVLIEITTPYWLGVETHSGQHGWILLDELEQLP